MKIWIVYVPDAQRRGPNIERINRVEDVPDELARTMLRDGSARKATAEELTAHEALAGAADAQVLASAEPTESELSVAKKPTAQNATDPTVK